jgi:transcriptional regulator with XRE-family HTH domain
MLSDQIPAVKQMLIDAVFSYQKKHRLYGKQMASLLCISRETYSRLKVNREDGAVRLETLLGYVDRLGIPFKWILEPTVEEHN